MLQYELARFQMRDAEAAAARARGARDLREPRVRRSRRAIIGRRLVRLGGRPAPAQT
ncbi:MAG: hypothetical protein J2P43_01735 [Candidatus Dormibacteraeota bacterium]|nr:hypothetical protein [Candidatus Dormibacteraeota bacterium]